MDTIGVITKMDYFVGTFLGILGHGTTWEYFVCGCYCFVEAVDTGSKPT